MKSNIMRTALFLIFLLLFFASAGYSAIEQRTALVIGNSNYDTGTLRNPVNDADDMADVLKGLGFEVILKKDVVHQDMEDAIRELGNRLKKGGVGLFFYAGHGVQIFGKNFLLPVGARIEKDSDVKYQAVDVDMLLDEMGSAGNPMNIVILDACRDNPFGRSFRSASRGLAIVSSAPRGTLVSYSTSPGNIAADGDGRNSPYTGSLMRHMTTPDLPIEEVFKNVRQDLGRSTQGKQIPWELSSLEGRFYFASSMVVEEPPAPSAVGETATGRLTVKSNVSGAKAYIDGAYEGDTPVTMTLNPGVHSITLKKAGYPDAAEQVRVDAGGAKTISIVMEKPEPLQKDEKTFTSPALGAAFVRIPSGTFTMGSPTNEPGREDDEIQHQVTISQPFYMQKTEVTQGQWRRIMGENPSNFSNCGEDCPVESVSWNDVQEFIQKLNQQEKTNTYRLPTEAEWEYAARAGTTTALYNGPIDIRGERDAPALDPIAWYGGNSCVNYSGATLSMWKERQHPSCSRSGTHPVGKKEPNAWGLYDMLGNVCEWVGDWYGEYPSGSLTDPTGPSSGPVRVVRGGCYLSVAKGCRSANRIMPYVNFNTDPSQAWRMLHRAVNFNFVGFRLLRTR